MLREIDEACSDRVRWEGLKRMKKEYTPAPYTIKDKRGHHVSIENKAEAKADYLATKRWGREQVQVETEAQENEDRRIRARNREHYQNSEKKGERGSGWKT